MKRIKVNPRYDWQTKVIEQGLNFHTVQDQLYWDESVAYEFDSKSIDTIDDVTQELHDMCTDFVSDTIASGNYSGYWFESMANVIALIEQSWKEQHPSMYGRFDLGIDTNGNIKMFEYNADTPTGLLEASVIQWNWKQDLFNHPHVDQFNSIHEKLIEFWKKLQPLKPVYFTAMKESPHEDWSNVHYLLETLVQAGYNGSSIDLEMIGWDRLSNQFVDVHNGPMEILFKLYPWEWLVKDEFFQHIPSSQTCFIEPAWKMLLSNKLLCVKLWERHPNHPNLLPAYHNKTFNKGTWIQKPQLGREGQDVEDLKYGWFKNNYKPGNIIQEKMNVVTFDGKYQPVIGSWIIDDKTAGIGIREDEGITTNNSRFIPHYFI